MKLFNKKSKKQFIEENTDIFFLDKLSSNDNIIEKIKIVERTDDFTVDYPVNFVSILENNKINFLNIKGTYFRKNENKLITNSLKSEHILSLYAFNIPIIFLIESNGWDKHVFIGTYDDQFNTLNNIVSSVINPSMLEQTILPSFVTPSCGVLTGIPSKKKITNSIENISLSIDMLLQSMNYQWSYVIYSRPVPFITIDGYFKKCASELENITNTMSNIDPKKADQVEYHYMKLLDKNLRRLNKGRTEGMWDTSIYIFAENEIIVKNAISLLVSIFSSDQSVPEPIKGHICTSVSNNSTPSNLITSKELSYLITLPEKEYHGFCLREWIDFDIDFQDTTKDSISIGNVIAHGVISEKIISTPIKYLTKHGLVAGTTGSGKSNTLFYLLIQIWKEHKVPFMVIEPTKSEYRNLSHTIKEDLLIFTLGDESPERSAPFRLNPFEFPEGVSLLTHIDYLKALFNAAFVMYGAMPHILEECLYEIYKDKGWLLVSSQNERGIGKGSFPTLTDLYNKIDEVVEQIGYEESLTMNFKSALKTRINNLRIGGKGLMLDSESSIPFEKIMKYPCVLELKYLGSDDEKTFVMGLILITLYEYYESSVDEKNFESRDLNHITLIEEAHRLLKNVPTEKSGEEQSNMKGMAIETFCNILSEIRAYNEGILVAEQIPTKLAPDIIKNTNMKILHRMVSKEERETMGQTMNLNKKQMSYASVLSQGEAIFFREGLDRPVLIRIPEAEISTGDRISSKYVYKHMLDNFYDNQPDILQKFPYCENCSLRLTIDCESVIKEIGSILRRIDIEEEAVRSILPCIISEDIKIGEHLLNHKDEYTRYCLEAHLVSIYIKKRSEFYNWSYKKTNEINQQLKDSFEKSQIIKQNCINETANKRQPLECYQLCENKCIYGYDISIFTQYFNSIKLPDKIDEDFILKTLSDWFFNKIDDSYLNILASCFVAEK